MKSLGNFPDPFIAEISGQPDALRRAAAGVGDQTAVLARVADLARGKRVLFTGMGSSYDACYPAVTALAQAGIPALHLDAAELLHFRTGLFNADLVVVAVSQSGESAEVVRAAQVLKDAADPATVIAVTNGLGNSLAGMADAHIDTRVGPESGPSTMTFGASVAVVTSVGRSLMGADADVVAGDGIRRAERAAVAIERLLADTSLPDHLADWFGTRGTSVILGRGPARAAAEMGALTIKEAVGIMIESLQTGQFRHGPLELAGPDLAAIILATEPETTSLDLGLAAELAGMGAAVLIITEEPLSVPGTLNLVTGPQDRGLSPAVSIVPAQLLAWRLAILHGREPGAYYRAAKVTTRE
jgi:glutamine---fructose-6-phosphate transaminase (isomerizing)